MRRQKICSGLFGGCDNQPCLNPGTVSCSRCERAANICNKPELIHYFCRTCYGVSNCKIGDSVIATTVAVHSVINLVVATTASGTIEQITSASDIVSSNTQNIEAETSNSANNIPDAHVSSPTKSNILGDKENEDADIKVVEHSETACANDENIEKNDTINRADTVDLSEQDVEVESAEIRNPNDNNRAEDIKVVEHSETAGANDENIEKNDKINRDIVDLSEDVEIQPSIQFNFDTASPRAIQKTCSNISLLSDDDCSESEEYSDGCFTSPIVLSTQQHRHGDGCCNSEFVSETIDETYENENFEWTESCSAINDALPPSFSASYLYVKDKADLNIMLIPGVSIINPPSEKRRPEIFVCALKCTNANSLNFLYAKIDDVETFFEEEIDKGRCISLDVRLNPPEALGTILPCLRETGTEGPDPEKLQKLFDKAAYSIKLWTTLCFISKAEFIAYDPSNPQGKFGSQPPSSNHTGTVEGASNATQISGPSVPASGRYNSRQKTVEQRQEQKRKSENQPKEQPKESKENKELKSLNKLKDKIQVLEDEKRSLKQQHSELKATRKTEIDSAVAKAESKNSSKTDQLVKQLDAVQQNLSKSNSKINELSVENTELKNKKREYDSKLAALGKQRSAGNLPATPVVVAESKSVSATPKLPTPASSVADEYKSYVNVIQKTETEIAIGRIKAESEIALAKMDEDKKLQEKAVDNAIILQGKKNALELLTPKPGKRSRSSSSDSSSCESSCSSSSSSTQSLSSGEMKARTRKVKHKSGKRSRSSSSDSSSCISSRSSSSSSSAPSLSSGELKALKRKLKKKKTKKPKKEKKAKKEKKKKRKKNKKGKSKR